MNRGKYIVLEGLQGVGKTSQLQILAERLRSAGLPVRTLREPDSQSSLTARAIRQLTQDPHYPMNTRAEVLLYNAARAQSLEVIRDNVEQGVVCLVDRNYLSTLTIQYYGRSDVDDYDTINKIINFAVGDMEPDLTVILDSPVQDVIARSRARFSQERFDNLDEAFLERVRAGYLLEAKQRGYPVVFATKSLHDVAGEVWEHVTKTLAVRKPTQSADKPTSIKEILADKQSLDQVLHGKAPLVAPPLNAQNTPREPLVAKDESGTHQITAAGQSYLEQIVTNPSGNVYAFTDKLSSVTVAAAMARLSRRGDDMRVTLLDEFIETDGSDKDLLKRVITAYGDDSVQQLVGQHLVVEHASNLLTKKLEWGRLAAYLEQSTRYIFFDQKDANGDYRYFTPEYLTPELKNSYRTTIDAIFDSYSEIVRKLTDFVRANSSTPKEQQDGAWKAATRAQACDAARPLLPVATTATVGIYASGQALESLIMHLLSDELPEAHEVGTKLLKEARKILPTFLERVDINERGVAWQGYRAETFQNMKDFATQNVSARTVDYAEPVRLVDYWPKNELDLVSDVLYEHSELSHAELVQAVTTWPYETKQQALKTYVGERYNRRHKPGRALEKAHYSWDLVCDYGIFRDLQRHRIVDALEWQQLTPRLGYDIPELIEKAGLTDDFEACFDASLGLHSKLQAEGYLLEAQYATLLGHKMRWKVTYNAREAFHLHELRTTPQGHPGYRALVKQMHDKLCEVHPIIGEAMKFVNKDEDPELTRLAAERYTQAKLQNLDKSKREE
jgi:dTMP kinase